MRDPPPSTQTAVSLLPPFKSQRLRIHSSRRTLVTRHIPITDTATLTIFLQPSLSLVPVWEVEDGRVRQCGWDGRKLRLLDSLDLQADICHPLAGIPGWARTRARFIRRSLQSALSPRDVVPAYWPYVRWKCLQRTLSAVLQVHATQV